MSSQYVPEDDRRTREPEPDPSRAEADRRASIPPPVPGSFTYDASGRSADTYAHDSRPDLFRFEHIEAKGLFALTDASGDTQFFRDKPVRYLVVEPNSQTGKFAPAVKNRQPRYL